MNRISLATFVLKCTVIANTYAAQEQGIKEENAEQLQATNQDVKIAENISSIKANVEQPALDPIITQAINFSNAIGDWFEDLFDRKQNMTFNAHVDKLEKIVDAMYAAIVKPVSEKNANVVTLAAYNITAILYGRAKETYSVLNENRANKSFWKITGALKKIDKKLKSEQEKIKLKNAFKDLTTYLSKSDPEICKKIAQLEVVVAENSTRTKKKGMITLALGLRHRLKCK